MSVFSAIASCFKALLVKIGVMNETGLASPSTASPGLSKDQTGSVTVAGQTMSWSDAMMGALGVSMLVAPDATGKYIGKVGSGIATAVTAPIESAGDGVLDAVSSWASKPIFWLILGGIALWWLADD